MGAPYRRFTVMTIGNSLKRFGNLYIPVFHPDHTFFSGCKRFYYRRLNNWNKGHVRYAATEIDQLKCFANLDAQNIEVGPSAAPYTNGGSRFQSNPSSGKILFISKATIKGRKYKLSAAPKRIIFGSSKVEKSQSSLLRNEYQNREYFG
jgi:hypothetical protein